LVDELCGRSLASGERFAVICLDLDGFRSINDNFGHQRGDDILRQVGTILRGLVGSDRTVARTGGDEFVVVVPTDIEAAESLVSTIQGAIAAHDSGLVHEMLGPIHLGVSVGIGSFPSDGGDFTTLISAAEARMQRDKTEHRLRALANPGGDSRQFKKAA
jgi:diguanylate cyclase (GGDEF)-like protein